LDPLAVVPGRRVEPAVTVVDGEEQRAGDLLGLVRGESGLVLNGPRADLGRRGAVVRAGLGELALGERELRARDLQLAVLLEARTEVDEVVGRGVGTRAVGGAHR